MSLNTIYKLAIVLTKSQLRGSQRSKLVARLFGDPRIILVVDALLLLALGTIWICSAFDELDNRAWGYDSEY